MVQAINNALEYTRDVPIQRLESDKILFHAVTYNIQIIGEAAYKLTNDFRESHPEVEWEDIIGMRHVLVHGYYTVDPSLVWNVVKRQLNPLKQQLLAYLEGMPNDNLSK